tara:strand:+ start:4231 stop:6225 length:1995 start_codon:yes stop_codon:yes gene_type:complete
MREELSFLYESVLISEMTDQVVDYVQENKEDLPFDSIFGDKMRIVIPIQASSIVDDIVKDLKNIKDFSLIDPTKGEIVRKIKLDPKYGRGSEKLQTMNIGKAIQSLKIDPEKKKKYMSWFAKYKDSLPQEMQKTSEHSIILSRSPIDVVRMSDHRNILSCHSEGSDYFECAVQEALTGGAIAYLVNTDTLEAYLDSDDFQNDDLFVDRDRNIRGLEPPLARLRVRMYVVDDTEYAIPEKAIYGDTSIPGFYKSLRDVIEQHQNLQSVDFTDKDLEISGGSYHDNDSNDLFSMYFMDNEDANQSYRKIRSSEYVDAGRETEHVDVLNPSWEDEMINIKDIYEERLTYSNIDATYEYEDEGYAMLNAEISFDMSEYDLPDTIEQFDHVDDYYITTKQHDEGIMKWSSFLKIVDSDLIGSGELILSFSEDYELTIAYGHTAFSADDVDTFFDTILDLDNDHDNLIDDVYQSMIQSLPEQDEDSDIIEFEKFEFERGYSKDVAEARFGFHLLQTDTRHIISTGGFNEDFSRIKFSVGAVHNYMVRFVKDIYKPQQNSGLQMEFKKFFESYTNAFNVNDHVDWFVFEDFRLNSNEFSTALKMRSTDKDPIFQEIIQSLEDNYPFLHKFIYFIYMNEFWDQDNKNEYPEEWKQLYPEYIKLYRMFNKYLT